MSSLPNLAFRRATMSTRDSHMSTRAHGRSQVNDFGCGSIEGTTVTALPTNTVVDNHNTTTRTAVFMTHATLATTAHMDVG